MAALKDVLAAQQSSRGAGIRILSETVTSPTLDAQIDELLGRLPQAKWMQWEPFGRHNAREGSRLAFGEYVDPQYAIDKADVVLSLDADFSAPPAPFTDARPRVCLAPAARRQQSRVHPALRGGVVAVEHRYESRPPPAAQRLGSRSALRGPWRRRWASPRREPRRLPRTRRSGSRPLVKDLQAARGRSLVIAGDAQPPVVHALAHAMNEALGNVGATVTYTQTAEARPMNQLEGLKELVGEMNAGTVSFLLILGGNPVYTAPADLKFAEALAKVALRAHVGLHQDETAALCHWHLPQAHFLESWSDVRAGDGTVSIIQPLIAPLYGGRSAHEVVAALSESGPRPAYELVRAFWSGEGVAPKQPAAASAGRGAAVPTLAPLPGREALPTPTPTPAPTPTQPRRQPRQPRPPSITNWRRWLHDGVMPNTAFAPKTVTVQASAIAGVTASPRGQGLDVVFLPDPERLRRPLCQQRLAAGAAQVADEADVGQRGADQPGNGGATRRGQRQMSSS